MIWKVSDFIPERYFGFCSPENSVATETKVFFHARDFIRLIPGEPGPILGEEVSVSGLEDQAKGRCARRVQRIITPTPQTGTVISYDPKKMWGFIRGGDGNDLYFHKREIIGSWLPLPGKPVSFFDGTLGGRHRACWVCFGSKYV